MIKIFSPSSKVVHNGDEFEFTVKGNQSGTVIIEAYYKDGYRIGDPLFEESKYSIGFRNIHLFPKLTNGLIDVHGGSLFLYLNVETNQRYLVPAKLFGINEKYLGIWAYYYEDIEHENSLPDNPAQSFITFYV